jgi:hypothetical protein
MWGWVYLALIQIIAFVLASLGIVVLIPFSIAHAWAPRKSREYPYSIMAWSLNWFDRIYGNEEDGIDGTRGYQKDAGGLLYQRSWIERTQHWPAWLQVYWWSAWRN